MAKKWKCRKCRKATWSDDSVKDRFCVKHGLWATMKEHIVPFTPPSISETFAVDRTYDDGSAIQFTGRYYSKGPGEVVYDAHDATPLPWNGQRGQA